MEASETVRTAGTNIDVLRSSQLVPGDSCTIDVDLSQSGHLLAVLYLGIGEVAVPVFGSDHVLMATPFASELLSGPTAQLRFDIPFGYQSALIAQAVLADFVLPLRFSNAVDLIPGRF